jgi:hypothetical protein
LARNASHRIVHGTSFENTGLAGVLIVDPLNASSLREAVLAFLDATYAKRKGEEAMSLSLPTWRSFAVEVCEVVYAGHSLVNIRAISHERDCEAETG